MPVQMRDPRVKLLISYDVLPENQQACYEFIVRQLIPKLQAMGLVMTEAWHTAYGDYPLRMAAFVAPDRETMTNALSSREWAELEKRFGQFATNLHWKVVPYKDGFQF